MHLMINERLSYEKASAEQMDNGDPCCNRATYYFYYNDAQVGIVKWITPDDAFNLLKIIHATACESNIKRVLVLGK